MSALPAPVRPVRGHAGAAALAGAAPDGLTRPGLVAATLGVLQVLAAAACAVSLLVTGQDPTSGWEMHAELAPFDLAMSLLFGPVGALVVVRSRHVVGWLFLAIAWGYTLTAAAIAFSLHGVLHPGLPGLGWAAPLVLVGWTSAILLSLLVLPFLLTPEGPRGAARVLAVAGVLVVAVGALLRLLVQLPGAPLHPLTGGGRVSEVAESVDDLLIPCYALLGLGVAAFVLHRRRRAASTERRGLTWLAVAHVGLAFSYLGFEIGVSLDGGALAVGATLLTLAEAMLLVAVFVLIRRRPDWQLDLAVSRTAVGLLLTVTLLAGYVVAVWAVGEVTPWGVESSGVLVVGGLALAVLPLREWLQRQVDRLVFGSGADPSVLLERVAQALAAGDPERSQLAGLLGALRRALRLAGVGVRLGDRVLAASGRTDDDRALHLDLMQEGRVVGALTVLPPRGERLDPRTVRLLRQISGLVAVAARLDEANRAVEQARDRLVAVREQERRLLRRELHDGIGPALSGTALALAAVPATSALSPTDAALLQRLVEELSRRADDVRQMARVLLPPALDEGRLGDALALLAERHADTRFEVRVDAPDADALPDRQQVVVYQVAAEALRNAARHSGGRRCSLTLTRTDGVTRLVVRDDGRGLHPGARPGVGLASMRERAAEAGGTVEVRGDDGGTEVELVLP